jgi:folylpolyglutamate synthase
VLERLAESLQGVEVDHVFFAAYDQHQTFVNGAKEDTGNNKVHVPHEEVLTHRFMQTSAHHQPNSRMHLSPSIQSVIQAVMELAKARDATHILITGSLHLVGGAIHAFQQLETSSV